MRRLPAHIGTVLRHAWSVASDRVKTVASSILNTGAARGGTALRKCLDHVHLPGVADPDSLHEADFSEPVELDVLNVRARIGREIDGQSWRSFLIVELCGTIQAPDEGHEVTLEVSLSDVTDSAGGALPVLNRPKQGHLDHSCHFLCQTDMGRLCHETTVLEDWTVVARLCPEWFVLPRQGSRRIQYNASVRSRQTQDRLASASCVGLFENLEVGYLDIEDNIRRAKTLAVGLAFSVAVADAELRDPEIDVIHGWVRTNFSSENASAAAQLEMQRALQKTAGFFRKGGRLNIQDICREIVDIAPMVGRLETLDLCLRVAGAKGQVTAFELTLLKDLATWLEVDRARLRAMAEKRLPVHMHQSQDAEMILGVNDGMSQDETRHQLNREYAKWSSRVISSNPNIRKQADEMLRLIADARTEYVSVRAPR